jgi:Holliday junction resolvase RusA-like endonuclease
MPPSTNALFRNVKDVGRVKSTPYKRWVKTAMVSMLPQRPKPIAGRVTVEITCRTNSRRDIDNIIKPVLDLLVRSELIEDDRMVQKVSAEWVDRPVGRFGEVEVLITEAGDAGIFGDGGAGRREPPAEVHEDRAGCSQSI